MSNLQTAAAAFTREMSGVIAAAIEAMPKDKQTWRPLDEGRNALDQLVEVVSLNFAVAETLKTKVFPTRGEDAEAKLKAEIDTVATAVAALRSSCDAVAVAVENLSDEDLDTTVTLPIRGGAVRKLSWMALLPARHMSYHWGQINYIQTLYGDREMHIPQ